MNGIGKRRRQQIERGGHGSEKKKGKEGCGLLGTDETRANSVAIHAAVKKNHANVAGIGEQLLQPLAENKIQIKKVQLRNSLGPRSDDYS